MATLLPFDLELVNLSPRTRNLMISLVGFGHQRFASLIGEQWCHLLTGHRLKVETEWPDVHRFQMWFDPPPDWVGCRTCFATFALRRKNWRRVQWECWRDSPAVSKRDFFGWKMWLRQWRGKRSTSVGHLEFFRTLLVEYRNFCRSRQVTFIEIRLIEGPLRALHFKKTNKAFNLRRGKFESATPATVSVNEMPQYTRLNWPEEQKKKRKEKVRRNEAFRLQSVCFSHTQIIRLISAGHVGGDRTTFFCFLPLPLCCNWLCVPINLTGKKWWNCLDMIKWRCVRFWCPAQFV